jgi:tetratricopeptide (TPR) repeat protein
MSSPEVPVIASTARLPVTARELFGRERELAWLDSCWEEGVRVASIVAWGGVGKSALVNTWLRGMDRKGWGGAGRVFGWSFHSQGTERLTSSDAFIDAALRELGDEDPTKGSAWNKGERLARLVKKQRMILILDGVEPLQWGPAGELGRLKEPALQALVGELGAQNKGLCLITSRLTVADLAPFSNDQARELALHHLSPEAGAKLLIERGAKGLDEELRAAAKEYDGHCLALTLLGSYLRKAHKGDVRKRDIIPPLEGEPARRMMAIYEQWFAGKPEISVLRMLGLFDAPALEDEIFALRASPPIVGMTDLLDGLSESAWNETITTLRDVGLLATASDTKDADELDAHPLVREHFSEQLHNEHPEAWQEGHLRLYEHLKKKAKPLPETIEEMAPLYAAVIHGCLAGKNHEARNEVLRHRIWRGGEAFSTKKLGAFGSEVAILSVFFKPPWNQLASGLTDSDQALITNQAGFALRALGRLQEAGALMQMSLDMCINQKDWTGASLRATSISEIHMARGELGKALTAAQRIPEFASNSGDTSWSMDSKAKAAAILHALGRWDEAAALFDAPARMQKAYPLFYSVQGFRYCDFLLDKGREADVLVRATQALKSAVRRKWPLIIALDHLSISRGHLLAVERGSCGDLASARDHIQQAVEGLRRAGYQDYFALGLLARAEFHVHTQAFAEAHRDLDEASSIATRCGFRLHETDAHLGYARLALAEQTPFTARAHLAKARTLISLTGYHRRDADLEKLEAMTRQTLLDALTALLPAQIEALLFKLGVPPAILPGAAAPPAERIIAAIRWAEQQPSGLADLERAYREITAPAPFSYPLPARPPAPARTPDPRKPPKEWSGSALVALADALADLYPSREEAHRVAKAADMVTTRIRLDGSPAVFWLQLLEQARNQGKIDAVIAFAQKEFPLDAALDRASAPGA